VAGINPQHAARALARRLAVQALYRWQLNPGSWQDLQAEFATDKDMPRANGEYFNLLLQQITAGHAELDAALEPLLDRRPALLDPVEHAVLWVAAFEMQQRREVPFRVVINEAVSLCKRFGATDAHKFINGVLDRAARTWRSDEH